MTTLETRIRPNDPIAPPPDQVSWLELITLGVSCLGVVSLAIGVLSGYVTLFFVSGACGLSTLALWFEVERRRIARRESFTRSLFACVCGSCVSWSEVTWNHDDPLCAACRKRQEIQPQFSRGSGPQEAA